MRVRKSSRQLWGLYELVNKRCCALDYPGLAMIAARLFSGIKKWRSAKTRTQTSKDICARDNAFLEAGG